jgi:uncharacterized cupredoxin-like copper-binding protein
MSRMLRSLTLLALLALGLSACGPASAESEADLSSDGPVVVQVNMTEFEIQSNLKKFKTGVEYHFVVTNHGLVPHEFMISPPAGSGHGGMDMAHASALIEIEELQPGESVTVVYTFTEPAGRGVLEMACHTEGHYEAGMKTPIEVSD